MYKCPYCEVSSETSDWRECEVGCEDCGSHPALECPNCGEYIDLIYHDLEEV